MTDNSVKMSAQHKIKNQNKKKYGIMRKEVESHQQDDSLCKAENKGRSMRTITQQVMWKMGISID